MNSFSKHIYIIHQELISLSLIYIIFKMNMIIPALRSSVSCVELKKTTDLESSEDFPGLPDPLSLEHRGSDLTQN